MGDNASGAAIMLLCLIIVSTSPAQCVGQAAHNPSPADKRSEAPTVTFTMLGMGSMFVDGEEIRLGFTKYEASDGVIAIKADYEFETAAEARSYFEKRVMFKSAKVIRREDKLDKSGKVVGERAQIDFPVDDKTTEPIVLWTHGKMFYEIFSLSLPDNLALEKFLLY